ncbi:alpha/beta hydrolase [Paraliomyxa miuraensis]|uniref:alpha/beta hydrolase n=1 Tax=Paraliomyxa miuraensis TaxID=376150 RepID=UPI00225BB2D0|nr:alpha/beta hydrolase-fold protein [Paraliomyxa miuraensis]MCX4248039.1 alpha/beta hydrolase-fold protein [Paraliomyxa miuraensis]
MKPAIHAFLEQGRPDEGAIDAFLRSHGFPLVEGGRATFVFRGHADAVNLRHWIYGLESSQPFERAYDTDLWFHVHEMPPGSRVEYKLEVIRNGHHEWIRDPFNPHLAHDPFGANSVAQGEGYARPAWSLPDPETRTGRLEELWLTETPFGEPRRVTMYLPARFRPSRRYPLLVVHDGGDYLRYAALKEVLDNLIHRLEVAPLIAALTHPGDRLVEYPDDPRHSTMIANELLPELERLYPLMPDARNRCLMGASFGAVASLATAWRHPGKFGRLLLQSGSFAFTDIGHHKRGPAFDRVVEFVNAFREAPGRPSERVYLSCGMYESLIYENRSLVPLLQTTGMGVRYEWVRDGHNWENWRDRLQSGLSWLFPGPLWMVYE